LRGLSGVAGAGFEPATFDGRSVGSTRVSVNLSGPVAHDPGLPGGTPPLSRNETTPCG